MFYPAQEEYLKSALEYNMIPVYTEIVVDMDTPISIYQKVCKKGQGYLLESVEGGENLARYSFIGFEPVITFSAKNGLGKIRGEQGVQEFSGSPLKELESVMLRYKAPKVPGLPRFYGGAVGYFGYELVRYFEELPDIKPDDLDLPDCYFVFTRFVLIYDHVQHKLKIVCNTEPGDEPEKRYIEALKQIEQVKKIVFQQGSILTASPKVIGVPKAVVKSNLTEERYSSMVQQAKEYIKAGDIFQVVLSQRFEVSQTTESPFDLYRNLRVINPAPYLYYLDFDEIKIIGSSPEMLVRVEDNVVATCPIAGTRPRGVTPEEDRVLELELIADQKEKAEHLMLVDLGRNDLGRVCKCGSIEVSDFMVVQRYSHVMHLVSNVKGQLREECTGFDALRACFPAGTLTGAPKIRAMEIIEELEPKKRGIYGGAIGYLSYTGNIDTCITIRTILMNKGKTYVQSGAGIVADSDPAREYQETINKAKALIETLTLREVG